MNTTKKVAYIFHVHNTFEEYHIDMAIKSIANQLHCTPMQDFILWNVSDTMEDEFILNKAITALADKFTNFFSINPTNEGSVRTDVNNQIKHISGYDWYFLHKSDFYLPVWTWNHFQTFTLKTTEPTFVNFAKFDCREKAVGDRIVQLAEADSFEVACSMDGVWRDFKDKDPGTGKLPLDHDAIGYRGIDGCMHFYNEGAREKGLYFGTFIGQGSHQQNINRGIDMKYGLNDFFVYHMYHALDRRNPEKRVDGFRF